MDHAVGLSVRGRTAKQERSERTRKAIIAAVVRVLAQEGVAGVTHRLVARRSGASLAATTYYFDSKQDMVAEASNELLGNFLTDFAGAAAAVQGGGEAVFRAFLSRVAEEGVGTFRVQALAWCEIVLDGARHPEGQNLARAWFDRLVQLWVQIARACGLSDPVRAAYAGMDISMGALFHGLALGMSPQDLRATLAADAEPDDLLALGASAPAVAGPKLTARAAATRERILEAAIRLLASGGGAGVNCRSAALEAGLTPGTSAYHFASSKALLAEAQGLLFLRSRDRHAEMMSRVADGGDVQKLVELMILMFQQEATEHGRMNLAGYAIWLQAARDPELRPLVRDIVVELCRGWGRTLEALDADLVGGEAVRVQYLFFGALIRAMAAGVTPDDMATTRARLKQDLNEIVEGRHWTQSPGPAARPA